MTTTKLTEGNTYQSGRTEMLYNGFVVAIRQTNGVLAEPCKRCGGSGHYSFNLMDGTVCYGCNGRGIGNATTEAEAIRKADNRAKARARAAAKEDARIAKLRADMDEWQAANAELVEALRPYLPAVDSEGYTDFSVYVPNRFLANIAEQAILTVKPLSDKQVAAARNAVAQQQQRDAERANKTAQKVATGHYGTVGDKVQVQVKVISCKPFDREFNGRPVTSWLITMETTDGHTVKTWTSGNFVSDAIDAENDKGLITIKAKVKAHGEYNGVPEATLERVTKL